MDFQPLLVLCFQRRNPSESCGDPIESCRFGKILHSSSTNAPVFSYLGYLFCNIVTISDITFASSCVGSRTKHDRGTMPSKITSISERQSSWMTGASVPRNGVYKVTHSEHALPNEVTLLASQTFPRCAACAVPVMFRLKRPLSEQSLSVGFHVELYELPVVEPLRRAS